MSWSVLLSDRYADYDAQVASAIEEAYQRGDAEARVNISGKPYLISFTPSNACLLYTSPSPTRPY